MRCAKNCPDALPLGISLILILNLNLTYKLWILQFQNGPINNVFFSDDLRNTPEARNCAQGRLQGVFSLSLSLSLSLSRILGFVSCCAAGQANHSRSPANSGGIITCKILIL